MASRTPDGGRAGNARRHGGGWTNWGPSSTFTRWRIRQVGAQQQELTLKDPGGLLPPKPPLARGPLAFVGVAASVDDGDIRPEEADVENFVRGLGSRLRNPVNSERWLSTMS